MNISKTQNKKKMKRFLVTPPLILLAALAFVGCDDDNDGPQIQTIGFEQAALGH